MNFWMRGAVIALLAACSLSEAPMPPSDAAARHDGRLSRTLDSLVPSLVKNEGVAGIGIAVIRDGTVVWDGYYGEQEPGVPVTRATAFNVASVAKTLTAETLLSLDAKGAIDLDEPIADYVTHEDLAKDARYRLLTARMLMAHRGGLLNWPYEYEDGKLAFDHDPGTRTSYSGAGVELAARYAEAKTGTPFPRLVEEEVLRPLGIAEAALGEVPPWAEGRMTVPMTAEGEWTTIEETNAGLAAGEAHSAADDLVVTVPAYAALIASLASGGDALAGAWGERTAVLGTLRDDPVYQCAEFEWLVCPDAYGHAVGWHSFRWDDHVVISHSGSDLGENAFVYVSPDTGNGAVIFVNGANGWPAMTRIMEAIGDEPRLADYYRGLIEARLGLPMPPLETTAR